MRPYARPWLNSLTITLFFLLAAVGPGRADDTCIFSNTADDVPPKIVLLLDNGAEMKQITWHDAYDNSTDYTPVVTPQVDVVADPVNGDGFFHDEGYGITTQGNNYYLVPISADLQMGSAGNGIMADSSDAVARTGVWTINGRTVTLPAKPSLLVDAEGIKDNATNFRYTGNYLNWIFYSAAFLTDTAGDGSDLPDKSRFYYAKSALMTVAKATANRAEIGINNFTATSMGAFNVQPLAMVVNTPLQPDWEDNTLDPNYVSVINNMVTVNYSPLAEGLASVGGYFNSASSHVTDPYCEKLFAIVVSPGVSSMDQATAPQSLPASLSDYDGDGLAGDASIVFEDEQPYSIPLNLNGSTYLDDVATYLYDNDIAGDVEGVQNVTTYTVGFMGSHDSNLFLINTSNNGNGNTNLYDTSDLKYGKYHFVAESPASLSWQILSAINDILTNTTTFTAPVVPVTRTTSSPRLYLAMFKPTSTSFWEGNVIKFGISSSTQIVDRKGNLATYPNGAIKEDAEPYWATEDWANPDKDNYVHNTARHIYTYMGSSADLTDATNEFSTDNPSMTAALLGKPAESAAEVINFVRGADVFDEDGDSDTTENRAKITGDVLHSEPVVVEYNADTETKMVYFGGNDGMLHAVRDTDGTEAWGFIPPDLLSSLKNLIEGTGHQNFVDSSPKVYIRDVNHDLIIQGDGDVDGDGFQDDMDGDGDIDEDDTDLVILVCGERKGGTGYFALDITYPEKPRYLWRINQEGQSGTLQLSGISGAFQDDEILTSIGRYATIDGTLTNFLRYDNQADAFTENTTVTGKASNATATIVAIDDLGADTGVLELSAVSGTFSGNEPLMVNTRLATVASPLFDYLFYVGAQPEDFPVGSVVTGLSSGAKGTVGAVMQNPFNKGPDTGFLELHNVTGTFPNYDPKNPDQDLSISVSASLATADGTLGDFLRYDTRTGSITPGITITGGVSGASGTISSVDDLGGNAGILRFSNTSGAFQDNEPLTVDTQLATVNGTLVTNGLGYETQLDIFAVGDRITGASSSATATITAITTTGTGTGVLELSGVAGSFEDNESLTINVQAALVNGTMFADGLFYDARTGNILNMAKPLIGVTSGAQADIVQNIDLGGGNGFMVLTNITGTFVDDEELTNNGKSIAYVNGDLVTSGLLFDNQTRSFSTGMTITGGSSGATATITSMPAVGILGLGDVSGNFQDNEAIKIDMQAALADGTLFDFLRYDSQTAPISAGIEVTGADSGATGTIGSAIDLGSNSGMLVFSSLSGSFQDNEGLMGPSQLALADGTLIGDGLRYDNQTSALNAGETVTGGSSSATGKVGSIIDLGGNAGILVFNSPPTGSFQDNEALIVTSRMAVGKYFVPNTIIYHEKLHDITVGSVVTGASSGHTGTVILSELIADGPDSDYPISSNTGLIALSGPTGSFQAGEGLLSSSATAVATAKGVFEGLRYDEQLKELSAGMTIAGETSGDTGTISSVTKLSFAEGILELSGATGKFQDNEALVSSTDVGVASADGTLNGSYLDYDTITSNFTVGNVVTGATSGAQGTIVANGLLPPPTFVVPELGETWSEPQFGLVKTADNHCSVTTATLCSTNDDCPDEEICGVAAEETEHVFFVGAGVSTNAGSGKAVLAVDVFTGATVRKFSLISGMDYSIPSTVKIVDRDSDGFLDKVYVGDLGGQVWRFGQFSADAQGTPLIFPDTDENIDNWEGQRLFIADQTHLHNFYYPPSLTLEKGYDLVFIGSGDRDDPCDIGDPDGTTDDPMLDRFYAIKDTHSATAVTEADLVDLTDPATTVPDLDSIDTYGWYIQLGPNEKVLAKAMVLFKALYFTTFTPSDVPCKPGGTGKLYAVQYKTAGAILDLNDDDSLERSVEEGGGIPSKPVIIIPDTGDDRLFISVGSTNPDDVSLSHDPGVRSNGVFGSGDFTYLWWREIKN